MDTIYGYRADGEALTTQVETMEYWFRNNVSTTISQRECSDMFGFDRLSDIVYKLRGRGMAIKTDKRAVKTRYGGTSYPAFYSYEPDFNEADEG